MKDENFGSIMYNNKMVNLDKSSISDLEKISEDLKEKHKKLKGKVITVFKQ